MAEYTKKDELIEVPKGMGKEGFLQAMRTILELPFIQLPIIIDRRGIRFSRMVRPGEDGPIQVDFESVSPYAILRNAGDIEEPEIRPDLSAALVFPLLFRCVSNEKLNPIGFVTGAKSVLWFWVFKTTAIKCSPSEDFYGLPVFPDRLVPDNAIILAAGYGRGIGLINTFKSFKFTMPEVP